MTEGGGARTRTALEAQWHPFAARRALLRVGVAWWWCHWHWHSHASCACGRREINAHAVCMSVPRACLAPIERGELDPSPRRPIGSVTLRHPNPLRPRHISAEVIHACRAVCHGHDPRPRNRSSVPRIGVWRVLQHRRVHAPLPLHAVRGASEADAVLPGAILRLIEHEPAGAARRAQDAPGRDARAVKAPRLARSKHLHMPTPLLAVLRLRAPDRELAVCLTAGACTWPVQSVDEAHRLGLRTSPHRVV